VRLRRTRAGDGAEGRAARSRCRSRSAITCLTTASVGVTSLGANHATCVAVAFDRLLMTPGRHQAPVMQRSVPEAPPPSGGKARWQLASRRPKHDNLPSFTPTSSRSCPQSRQYSGSTHMTKPDCPRCHSPALVRKETVVKAAAILESFYCGRCDHTWNESGDRAATPRGDGDRPDHSRPTPRNRPSEARPGLRR
jgi:hypothetical protein